MNASFIVIAAVVLAVAAWWLIDKRRTSHVRKLPTLAQVTREQLLPQFQVVALGAAGSGKTALLASLHHELQTPAGRGYYLTLADPSARELTGIYLQLADPGQKWHAGTRAGQEREFVFTCVSRSGHQELARITYVDYAGELLTEIQPDADESVDRLQAYIRDAHALLLIIDGLRLYQYFAGQPQGAIRLEEAISTFVRTAYRASCPVHFVITKWDLLESIGADDRDRLRKVRDLLLSNPHFRSLVTEHSRDRIIRLIPVSAVGSGFARVDEHGHVVKQPTASAKPQFVDLPLATVIPDIFRQLELQTSRTARETLLAEMDKRLALGAGHWLSALKLGMAGPTGAFIKNALGTVPVAGTLGVHGMELFVQWLSRPALQRYDITQEQLLEAGDVTQRLLLARHTVLDEFERRVAALESILPESNLSDGPRM
ncbi:TRAFAC clade GTPase domain-containing protein [Nonomuraea sp. SYSU D8015]|uniref:TRAFAC clade GTPase domain-containing protein n=1 Tax=Nonomuraea sp. SYSU D8015 TaxID=2593644 RepID=UPI001660F685|nr:hypothetical protein [Nonomuraea sp. SYSU D8015]